ncbi:MAG: AI-2E family transporter [Oscillospiraceae bacterium]|nr:AI-2E family transporter [Oscillospiraceae bacterium]
MDKRLSKTLIFSGAVIAFIVFLLFSLSEFIGIISYAAAVLRPIIIGCITAFILNKPLGFFHSLYFSPMKRKIENPNIKPQDKPSSKSIRRTHAVTLALAIVTVYIIFIGLIVGFCWFVIPQLIESVNLFIGNFDTYFANLEKLADKTIPFTNMNLHDWLVEKDIKTVIYDKLTEIAEKLPTILVSTFNITASILGGLVDFFLGFILSIYILGSKYKLKAQASSLLVAFVSPKIANKISYFTRIILDSYSTFFSVQFFDSFLLGILCFIAMTIFGFDYAPLISTIVGVTNMIPIVGPWIGTVPCVFVLLMVDPVQALWFVVLVVVVQQIDSNLIYPRVVGNSIGLPSLWVLVAVIVGGGFFGVFGILLSIPLFSIIYTLISNETKRRKELMAMEDVSSEEN